MPHDQERILHQKDMVKFVLDDEFFDSLGPYDYDGFRHTSVHVDSFSLGWMRFDLAEYSCHPSTWPERYSLPPELLIAIWVDVLCTWDPEEADNPGGRRLRSLKFEISNDIDFGGISFDDPELPEEVLDNAAYYACNTILDGWRDEFEKDYHPIGEFIALQPEGIRNRVRACCGE